MRMIQYGLLLVVGVFFTLQLPAQYRYQYLKIGVTGGATSYLGDLDNSFPTETVRPGFGGFVSYRFNPMMTARFSVFQGTITGDDALSKDPEVQARNLHFRSFVREASIQLVFDFFFNEKNYAYRPDATPYMFVGLGMYSFNPQAKIGNNWIDLQPLGTEGQFVEDPIGGEYPEPYKLQQLSIPLGIGYRMSIGRDWDVEVEIGWRKTFTDYLDDVSGYYPNRLDIREQGGLAERLSDPSDPNVFPEGRIDEPRGNRSQNDWFIYSNVSISYILDWEKCFKPRRR